MKYKSEKKGTSFIAGAFILTLAAVFVKIIGALFKVPLQNLYGGEGGDVGNALWLLSESGEPGEYLLIFSLEDALGGTYLLNSSFLVDREISL